MPRAQIKKSEYESCVANGVKNDHRSADRHRRPDVHRGARTASSPNLTQADIYKALAANPFGKGPNTAQTWKDVNPALPAIKIRVLGPPPTSGTRDSLADLYLEKGCNTDPAMEALKKSDEAKHKDICTKVREDGAYVEAGENDNLLVQKVSAEPGTLGVLGYSATSKRMPTRSKPVQIAGVSPTEATIADLSYPGARKLYIYLKGEHLAGQAGAPRLRRGLCEGSGARAARSRSAAWFRSPARTRKRAAKQATELKPLDPADAEVSIAATGDARNCLHRDPADRRWRSAGLPIARRRASARAAAGCTRCPIYHGAARR